MTQAVRLLHARSGLMTESAREYTRRRCRHSPISTLISDASIYAAR